MKKKLKTDERKINVLHSFSYSFALRIPVFQGRLYACGLLKSGHAENIRMASNQFFATIYERTIYPQMKLFLQPF